MVDLKETVSSAQQDLSVMKVKKTEELLAQKHTTVLLVMHNYVLLELMVLTKLAKYLQINACLVLQVTTVLMALLRKHQQVITHPKLVLQVSMDFISALLDSTALEQPTLSTRDVLAHLAISVQQELQNTSMLTTNALRERGVTG